MEQELRFGLDFGPMADFPGWRRFVDNDISWTMTSRGHFFSKWATSRGHSQRVTFRGHFW